MGDDGRRTDSQDGDGGEDGDIDEIEKEVKMMIILHVEIFR